MNTRFCPGCRRHYGDLETCPTDGQALHRLPEKYPPAGGFLDGRLRLEGAFAEGGMSRIYRGTDQTSGRPVAVKVLDPRLTVHPYTIDRFYREARVSSLLNHDTVVEVIDYGPTADGHQVMVMELLGGESLGQTLRRHGRLPWERTVRIALELCEALGHAHSRRVVHRDVKPENIQLMGSEGPDERVKLLDFGVAYVAADRQFSRPSPGSASVSGTPAYMSPEQIRGLPLDGRSDLYALGTVIFEAITGERPFAGDDPVEVCRRQLFDRPATISQVAPNAEIPGELDALVKELLAKSPRSRVPGVGALMQRLMTLLPREEWPTRLRQPVQRGRRERGRTARHARRIATTDLLAVHPTPVTILQAEIRAASIQHRGTAAWPEPVDRTLAGWRALVEESGGLIQQPEPDALRAVFGLFHGGGHAEQLIDAANHALRLRDLLTALCNEQSIQLAFRGCITQTIVVGGEDRLDLEYHLTQGATASIRRALALAPDRAFVVAAESIEGLAERVNLTPVQLSEDTGADNEAPAKVSPVFLLSGHEAPGPQQMPDLDQSERDATPAEQT